MTDFNLAAVHEAVSAAIPDRECIVWRDRRLTYADITDRTRRLANFLAERGVGPRGDRSALEGHESHQDHLAIYLHNGNEYLETMLGSYKARVAPFNVNYRYVEEELTYLLDNSAAKAIVYHSAFAPTLANVLADLPELEVLIQVDDDSGNALLPGAVEYEAALAGASAELPAVAPDWSTDDLYILYTGGTTGMPKGVLWRQADIYVGALGGRNQATNEEFASIEDIVATAEGGGARLMPAPPFMHGAGHWLGFNAMNSGHTVVIQDIVDRLDPADVWSTIQAEQVNILLLVGDAFARPLVEELEQGSYDTSTMLLVVSGGAPLNSTLKDRFLAAMPNVMIMDAVGASETGSQMSHTSAAGQKASTGTFTPGPGACVVSPELDRLLDAGHQEEGWLAQQGRVPLGYLGDAEKTAKTFPVIDGIRYSVPGDRARLTADGIIELYGRDSVTINSGGEKIFAEEVEQALAHHPDVFDVVVAGRPSERWGNEVIAIVQPKGGTPDEESLLAEAAKHIARYKLPKAFVFVDEVLRSPAGKADYRWAKEQALEA